MLLGLALCALGAAPVHADSLKLTFNAATIRFPAADPSFTPSIAALENPIPVSVRSTGGGGNWILTVIAAGDLVSGSSRIPISQVSWTATGAAFEGGTMSSTRPQTAGSGGPGPGDYNGTLRFFLLNSWNYETGNYAQTITFSAVSF